MPWKDEIFNAALKKKYDIAQQEADSKGLLGQAQAQYYAQRNPTDLATTSLQFGPGGASDRTIAGHRDVANLQYGPGGASDRGDLATERRTNVMYGPGSGYSEHNLATARHAGAQAGGLELKNRLNTELYPENLANERSSLGLETTINQDMLKQKNLAAPKRRYADWFKSGQFTTGSNELAEPTSFMGSKVNFRPLRSLLSLMEQPRRMWDSLFAND